MGLRGISSNQTSHASRMNICITLTFIIMSDAVAMIINCSHKHLSLKMWYKNQPQFL